ncbi:MAG: hypothetical protein V1874_03880 [Spirochaetota bacterium]
MTLNGYGEIPYWRSSSQDYLQYEMSGYLAIKNKSTDKPDEPVQIGEQESPFRRFEIAFFISAPFVFIITFAGLYTYGLVRKQNTGVSVWQDYKPALLIGTFGISSVIAAREAWITMEENSKNKLKSLNRDMLIIYANKNF